MPRVNLFIFGLTLSVLNSTLFASSYTTFIWTDINSREVVRWEGDTAVVKHGSVMQELVCKIEIDPEEVKRAADSFGVPKSWTTFTYIDEKDLARKQQQLHNKAQSHGIRMLQEGNKFTIDYNWVTNQNKQALTKVAKRIRSTARRNGYRSKRDLTGAFASFVQSMPYRVPADYKINNLGEKILTAGAMMPLETLACGWGDCDSKSMLFAALVQNIGLVDVCFIVMEEHLFAAVQLRPEQNERSIRYKNKDWVLIELTDSWPIGRIPKDRQNAVDLGNFKVVELR
ncbi:MAG: hypothetical protein H8E86_01935 [Planctomycetes bacterium]|nr:hypothetical protein [Planctomycetota bacterium]